MTIRMASPGSYEAIRENGVAFNSKTIFNTKVNASLGEKPKTEYIATKQEKTEWTDPSFGKKNYKWLWIAGIVALIIVIIVIYKIVK